MNRWRNAQRPRGNEGFPRGRTAAVDGSRAGAARDFFLAQQSVLVPLGGLKINSLRTGLCRFLPIEARRSALWGQADAVFSPFRLGARLSEDRPMPFSPR